MRANITIPKEQGWDSAKYAGHLPDVYLNGAADRIVHDIAGELGALKTIGTADSSDGCFTPPKPTIADNVQKVVLNLSDPMVEAASSATSGVGNGALTLVRGAFSALAAGADALQSALGIGSTNTSQVSAAALPFDGQQQIKSAPSPAARSPASQPPSVPKENTVPPVSPVPQEPVVNPPAPRIISPFARVSISPGFGGGGGGSNQTSAQNQSNSSQQAQNTANVSLSVASPSDGALFTVTPVTFTGTTDAGTVVTAVFATSTASTTSDGSGNWLLPLALSEGTTQVDVSATNADGQSSATISRTITMDFTAPATTTVSVADCSASLLAGICLVPTLSVDIAWTAATDASYYGIAKNGVVSATTTALVSQVGLTSGATTTIAVVSYDAAGNAATSTSVDVAAISQPLLINEIGWGGIGSSDIGSGIDHTNQWIEIKNNTLFDLDMSHVSLSRSGGATIPLSGTLPGALNQRFLVIASGNPNFFGAHTLTVPFVLATTSAEQLALVWNNSTTLDATPEVGTCSGWCVGAYETTIGTNVGGHIPLSSPRSMERKVGTSDGTLASSWQENDGYFGISAYPGGGYSFSGSPGLENSLGLPDAGVYCGSVSNLLIQAAPPGPPFAPTDTCTFLTHFMTPGLHGAQALTGTFRGDVGSSTGAVSFFQINDTHQNVAAMNPAAGEHFFFAIAEFRFGSDNIDFNNYFTQGASTTAAFRPPHGNYVTFPFTYQQ